MTRDTRDMMVRACDVDVGRDESPRKKKGRETKQEREERLTMERQRDVVERSSVWSQGLGDLLARCTKVGFEFTAHKDHPEGQAIITVSCGRWPGHELTLEWSEASENAWRNCLYDVEQREAEIEEETRQRDLATQARSKLTKEELAALKRELSQ